MVSSILLVADKDIIIEGIQSGGKETLASINNVYHGPHTAKYSFNAKGIASAGMFFLVFL